MHAAKACFTESNIDPNIVDTCAVGNVSQTNADTVYLSRHVALQSGMRIEAPCLTVNRLCGSGFQVRKRSRGRRKRGENIDFLLCRSCTVACVVCRHVL